MMNLKAIKKKELNGNPRREKISEIKFNTWD